MILPTVISSLERVLQQSAGSPQYGLPAADVVVVRAENLRAVLNEVRILDEEIREFLRSQDVNIDSVHEWYYERIKNRLEREGVL